jgi:hypothetical protein
VPADPLVYPQTEPVPRSPASPSADAPPEPDKPQAATFPVDQKATPATAPGRAGERADSAAYGEAFIYPRPQPVPGPALQWAELPQALFESRRLRLPGGEAAPSFSRSRLDVGPQGVAGGGLGGWTG